MASTGGCGCDKDCGKCNDCNKDENPCGCDVIVDPSKLSDCCSIWVMCPNECGTLVPQKVSLMALKQFFKEA